MDENYPTGRYKTSHLQYDVGSPVRITNNTTSQSVTVPAIARSFMCIAEGGSVRLEIGGAASSTSTLYIPEDTALVYPIVAGSQTLFCYGLSGTYGNFRFLV